MRLILILFFLIVLQIGTNGQCAVHTAPYLQNFESSVWQNPVDDIYFPSASTIGTIDTCWTTNNNNGFMTGPWVYVATNVTTLGPTNAKSGSNYILSNNSSSFIKTPKIDIGNLSSPIINFWHIMYTGSSKWITVYAKDHNDTSWTALDTVHSTSSSTINGPWQLKQVALPLSIGDTIEVRLQAGFSGFSGFIAIDDFSITDGNICVIPNGLNVVSKTNTAITLDWASGTGPWQIKYGITFGSDTTIQVTSRPYTITGLTDNTSYTFRVRENCFGGFPSQWSNPYFEKTTCLEPLPHYENFEGSFGLNDCYNQSTFQNIWGTFPTLYYQPLPWNNQPAWDHTTGNGWLLYTLWLTSALDAGFTTPQFDLSSLQNPELSFWYYAKGNNLDKTLIKAIIGANTVILDSLVGFQQTTSMQPWKIKRVDLSAYTNDTVQIVFESWRNSVSNPNDFYAIDDIQIDEYNSCLEPDYLQVLANQLMNVEVDWQGGGAGNWQLKLRDENGNISWHNTANPSYLFTNLLPGSNYLLWVRDSCGAGQTSGLVGPLGFKTDCQAVSGSYLETFDGPEWAQGYEYDDCWYADNELLFNWNTFYSFNTSTSTGPNSDHTSGQGKFISVISGGVDTLSRALYSPWFSVSGMTNPHLRSFHHMYGSDIISLRYYVETLSGSITLLDSIYGQQQNAQNAPWDSVHLSLANFATDTFRILIKPQAAGALSAISIDDFEIFDAPCKAPDSITASGITTNSATIHWGSEWPTSNLEYGPAGFALGSGTALAGVSSGFILQNLSPFTWYDVYLIDSCLLNTASSWSAPLKFKTICPIPTANFTYSQMDSTFTFVADTSSGASLFLWEFGDGNFSSGASVQHTYNLTKTPPPYLVSLRAVNNCGQSDTLIQAVNSTIGLEVRLMQKVVLFPNPTSAQVNIQLPVELKGKFEINVYDALGKRLDVPVSQSANQLSFDLSNYADGLYSVKFIMGEYEIVKRISLMK